MTTVATRPVTITTGSAEIDKKLGGGIPGGSLTLIEGQSDAGKSVLCQHLVHGSLLSGLGVAYYTAENTVKSLVTQMASLSLDVLDHFLIDRLRIYPVNMSSKGLAPEIVFSRLTQHIGLLPDGMQMVVLDSITNVVSHSGEGSIIDFFTACKRLCERYLQKVCKQSGGVPSL